ncbi:MAG: efflux RND transporter permease subunit [Firmicutes bacterium]|nr:efflux RND transporter permease subunit [Bacillota bacterium]
MDSLTVFIRRPILATMIILSMVVLGAFSYTQLGVDSMPKVDFPLVYVVTQLPGASPEEIETEVTKPIEDAVAVIGGIRMISSQSQNGVSSVNILFQLEINSDIAVQQVRDKVTAIINQFPDGTFQPVIDKADPNSSPILILAVHGKRDAKEITEITKNQIKDTIESVDGVGQVNMIGARYRIVDVVCYADKLTKFGLSMTSVQKSIVSQNTEVPGGRVTSKNEESILRTYGRLSNVESFSDIIVKDKQGTPIKLKDVGYAIDTTKEPRTMARLNGEAALVLQVIKTTDANTVEVIKDVKTRISTIQKALPSDVSLEIVKDSSIAIEESVNDILVHLYLGGGLACLMVFMFMGSLRSTFIAAIAIPASVVSSFTVMLALQYTLNQVTLLALALVVGIVIDDAIVVLENVWRLIEEEEMKPFEAAIEGTKEIGPAVLATTLSLIVLFVPVAFMPGIVGRYFQSYGITMAVSIFISMVVSFVLTPMLCSKLLKKPKPKKGEERRVKIVEFTDVHGVVHQKKEAEVSAITKMIQDSYEFILKIALKIRFIIVILCVACFWWGGKLSKEIGQEFITNQDGGEYNIVLKLPNGWSMDRSANALIPIEDWLRKQKGVKFVLTQIGTQTSGATDDEASDITVCNIYVRMVDYDERKPFTQFDAMRQTRRMLDHYQYFRPSVQMASSSSGGSGGPDFSYSLMGDDLEVLKKSSDNLQARMRKIKGYVEIDTDVNFNAPEVHITVDRPKAYAVGVDMNQLSNELMLLVGGAKISNYQEGKWLYDVRIRLDQKDRDNIDKVRRLYIPTKTGNLCYLSGVADISPGLGPSQINHVNRARSITLQANLEGYPQVQAMNDAVQFVKDLNLPPGYSIYFQGNSQYVSETAAAFAQAFVLAIIFMYMVLASQFENLLDPLIILLTLPLSIPFAILSLKECNMTLNMFSALGLFLLFGIVKKNGILQVDHTNNLRKMGYTDREAILKANRERVRPILMTTLTLVVGMLPVALSGPTGATRAPMAVVVVGGQSLCLILTLLLVPVLLSYVYDLERFREWKIWKLLGIKLKPHKEGEEEGESEEQAEVVPDETKKDQAAKEADVKKAPAEVPAEKPAKADKAEKKESKPETKPEPKAEKPVEPEQPKKAHDTVSLEEKKPEPKKTDAGTVPEQPVKDAVKPEKHKLFDKYRIGQAGKPGEAKKDENKPAGNKAAGKEEAKGKPEAPAPDVKNGGKPSATDDKNGKEGRN